VELSPGSEIHVAFDGQVRRVELLRGTAHFDVAKDRQRPFLACAGSMRARAVGTAFAMEVGIMDLVVVVTEGRVAIEPASAPVVLETTPGESAQPGLLAALGPGDRARVTHAETMDGPGTPHVTSLSPQEIREALGWRVPRLEFSATPLSRVIEMFHEVDVGTLIPRIILDDPELGRLRLQGILRADDVDTLLLLLKSEFGVESHREPGVIRLRKAQD
jgi:transmembrane sensor